MDRSSSDRKVHSCMLESWYCADCWHCHVPQSCVPTLISCSSSYQQTQAAVCAGCLGGPSSHWVASCKPIPPGCVLVTVCGSIQVYVFGGMTLEGALLDDLWTLELDNMQWSQLHTFGTIPCARKGGQQQYFAAVSCNDQLHVQVSSGPPLDVTCTTLLHPAAAVQTCSQPMTANMQQASSMLHPWLANQGVRWMLVSGMMSRSCVTNCMLVQVPPCVQRTMVAACTCLAAMTATGHSMTATTLR